MIKMGAVYQLLAITTIRFSLDFGGIEKEERRSPGENSEGTAFPCVTPANHHWL